MKLLKCPVNGWRPLSEFVFGGELRPMPDSAATSDDAWADYVFNRAGEPGVRSEWWYHSASGTWFIAQRDNLDDEFLRTYLYDEVKDEGRRMKDEVGRMKSEVGKPEPDPRTTDQ